MTNWVSWAAFDRQGVTELAKVSLLFFFSSPALFWGSKIQRVKI